MVIIGDSQVGKTSIIASIKAFFNNYHGMIKLRNKKSTRFFDIVCIPCKNNIFQVWDLQGRLSQTSHPLNIIPNVIMGYVRIVIFVYSTDNNTSFDSIWQKKGWYNLIKNEITSETLTILVGNQKNGASASIPKKEFHQILSKVDNYFLIDAKDVSTLNNLCTFIEAIFEPQSLPIRYDPVVIEV
jgi:GTPase SAR1 family protein